MKKYYNIHIIATLLLIVVTIASSCKDNEPDIEIPATYEFMRNGNSTVSFSGQTTRILMADELIASMLDFSATEATILEKYSNQDENGGEVSPFENEELNASTKSVKSKVAASKDFFSTNTTESADIKAQFATWISAQTSEVYLNEEELAEKGIAGQIADGTSTRYVNPKGLEYNQAVAKGLIGALMVDQMLNNYLSTAVLDEGSNRTDNDAGTVAEDKSYTNMEHKWDEAYGYLFGGSGSPQNPILDLGADNFLNKYLKRVNDDEDFAGIADEIFEAFKAGRAAIVAGDYKLRDENADIIKDKVSEIIGIRAVYYLQQGKKAFPAFGTAFHDLSEGFGFIYSLRFTRKAGSNDSYFTKSEVDGYIADLLADDGFWDVTPETLDRISDEIASRFDFTVAQAAE